ncbi:MAG: glycoside hydrolase family 127 protein, partial [Bacteroidaceae bacterium]
VVEMALVRLYELTGEERYLNGCKFFLDCRGVRKFDPTSADQRVNGKYWQDHLPAIQQRTAEGHAVRAMYFYSGMADWVRYSADKDYETAVTSIWNNIANCKFYITGGFGARDNNEAFGENYELPNATAYCETCASVAGSMFNLRMFRLHGEGKYIDMMERALYNTVLDGYGIEGKTFYYPNRLASSSRGDSRSEWFGTSCCPTNLCRLIPSVPGYIYATSDDELYWNLFVASDAHVTIGNTSTDISVTGQYPYKGSMRLTMNSINGDNPRFTLKVRIPGWTGDHPVEGDLYRYVNAMTEPVTICINGEEQTITTQSDGYAILEREWKEGDYVDVNLPMDVRQVLSNDLLTSNQGLCAYERGPIVYCAEGEDNNGLLDKVYIPLNATTSTATAPYSLSVNFRGGIQQIKANGYVCNSQDAETTESEQLIRLIPYHARASRTACQMKVWIPYDPLKAEGVINFLDEVKICDESSEKAHNLQGTNMRSGSDLGWRDAVGGWISYDMLVKPDKPMDFIAKHWGSDGGNRKFKILCDGEEFSYDHIDNFKPGEYYYMRHPIPYELTKGKQKVTITMKAESNDDLVGGIYGAYTALSENTPVETTPMDHMWTSQESSVTAHAYSSNGGSGFFRGRTWLDGSGTIGQSWNMQVNSTNRNYLMLLYWGEESDMRIFDIYCDNVFVASESLCLNDPGRFIMRCYPIPEESTSGKNKIRIRITSPSGTKTGGIFYAYMMSTNGENTSVRPIMPNIPEETCYDLQGIKRESPISGINLISSPDGLRKVFMQ